MCLVIASNSSQPQGLLVRNDTRAGILAFHFYKHGCHNVTALELVETSCVLVHWQVCVDLSGFSGDNEFLCGQLDEAIMNPHSLYVFERLYR